MARAVQTDLIGNKLPVITPFHLFEKCIDDNLDEFKQRGDCPTDYGTVPVPSIRY